MSQRTPSEQRICHACGFAPTRPGVQAEKCPQDGRYLVPLEDHQAHPDDPLLGRRFAEHYPVLGIVGLGGMATVYRALQEQVGREVALKVVRTDRHSREELERRFAQEARVIAKLRHPNIVTLYDAGVHGDGTLYMVMELVAGRPLSRVLGREIILIARAVELVTGVLEALVEAHDNGLVHRDLKPANLMVVPGRRGGEQVMVLDFGLAKALHPDDPISAGATAEGMVVGTPLYMSPEQAAGRPVDHRSDLYSLGVVLYELLAGRPPFNADTAVEIAVAHCKEPPPRLPASRAVPPGLERVVMRALEKDPERRFESASAMLEALRSAHSSEASAETIDPAADTGPPAGTAKQQAPPPRPGSPDWLIPTDQSAAPGPGAAATPDAPPLDVAEVPDASSPRPPLEGGPPPEEAGQSSLATFHRTRTASFRERHSFGLWYWIILLALAFGAWKFGPPLVETVRLRYVLWQATEAVDPGTGRLRVRYDVEKRLTEAGFDPEALRLEVEVDYTEKLKLKSVAIGVDYERQVTYPGVDYTTVLPFRPSFRRSF